MILQYPPPPVDFPPTPPTLFECCVIAFNFVMLVGLMLPRPWFRWLFKCAFPFMPDTLEELESKLRKK